MINGQGKLWLAADGRLFGSGSVQTRSERVRKILDHPEPRTGPMVRFSPSPEPRTEPWSGSARFGFEPRF